MFTFPFTLAGPSGLTNTKSILFGGTNENIEIPFDVTDFGQLNNISAAAWMKTTSSATMAIFAHLNTVDSNRKWSLGMAAGKFRVIVSNDGTASTNAKVYDNTVNIDDGNWHHVALTFTTDTLTLYVDGAVVSSPTKLLDGTVNTLFNNTGVLRMAAFNTGTTSPMVGNIDEPSYWDKQLSAAEISEIYNGGVPTDLTTHSASANLIEWWRNGDDPLDDSTADTGVITAQVSDNDGIPRNTESGDIVIDSP